MVSGGVRLCQVVSGGVPLCQVVSGGIRWCQEVSGGVRWCQVVQGVTVFNIDSILNVWFITKFLIIPIY